MDLIIIIIIIMTAVAMTLEDTPCYAPLIIVWPGVNFYAQLYVNVFLSFTTFMDDTLASFILIF